MVNISMHTKEHIEQKIQELELQKSKILRSFGGRYSRRFNGIKYNPEKFKNKNDWQERSALAQIRAFKNIKNKKNELKQIDAEIYKLQRELAKIEMEKPSTAIHSERFNQVFKRVMDNF